MVGLGTSPNASGKIQSHVILQPNDGVETEADAELKVIMPILTGSNFLEIPESEIKAKDYLQATPLDKTAGKTKGYYPDFSIWANAFPILIVEAKAPEVEPEVGYREASLYARHLNQGYRSRLNPCKYILSCNGVRLLVGYWDSTPELDLLVDDLRPGTITLEQLRDFCHHRILNLHGSKCLLATKTSNFTKPYSRAGGQAIINSKRPFNTFAENLAPVLRRYFSSTNKNNNAEIYERAYVSSDEITAYDRTLEALLKDRIISRRGSLTQDLHPSRSREPKLAKAIDDFASSSEIDGQLQLIIGGVGAGKSLFARRYKERLQSDQSEATSWAFIDFNAAPANLKEAQDWLCDKFVESFREENTKFDPFAAENLSRIFSQDIQKRQGIYAQHRAVSEIDEKRARAKDLQKWYENPQKLAFGICRHFLGDRSEVVVVVMDNVDRLDLGDQLLAFQLALWFLDQSRAFVILQLRDETYERFKDQPPLDTYRTGVAFHISPPRFIDVVKRRLELSLEFLAKHSDDRQEYQLSSGARIVYPKTAIGDFLRGIYAELFEHANNISRILQGLAGRDVRKALEMFASIINSGHLREEAITSIARGNGEFSLEEYTVLRILMRTEYRFFSDKSGFISNIFYVDDEWENPNNFLVADILFYLCDNRKINGAIGLEGYFSIEAIADVMQYRGYLRRDVFSACKWLTGKNLAEADHLNQSDLDWQDSIKITASGFIHIRILSERMEYLYGVLSVTPISDQQTTIKISSYLEKESRFDSLYPHQIASCIEVFYKYLEKQHSMLSSSYPSFNQTRSGASYILSQIEDTLKHFKNPRKSKIRRVNALDE